MKSTLIIIIGFFLCWEVQAQEDLLKELENEGKEEVIYAHQTFDGTRIVNGQSVETKGAGSLEFIFSHRFGRINTGAYNLWGLDDAYVRLGLEYGITDRFGVGIGRSSTDKTYDGFLRYKITRQSSGQKNIPVTIVGFTSMNIKTSPNKDDDPNVIFNDRLAYVTQFMIARKFSSKLSAQVTPVYIHRNTVDQSIENNDDFALGIGARYKITRSLAITGEYFYRINPNSASPNYNSMGIGLDIETGGHVFQLLFTNSLGMIERSFIEETSGDVANGDIHFGFNISRNFQLGSKRSWD
ncbi:MAG: hypothetical protein HC811_02880 [Flammeovirgaceae bacterium]|nr:hypothetical protein [Flammeovirgaceae bacterium]